jgi:hypothetical protein
MICIKLDLTALAAGQLAINEFNSELEQTWMPGFSRSYDRRQEAYAKATQRYEERNLFLRLLFKKPKKPQRPPARYSDQVAVRLRQDWLDSMKATTDAASRTDKDMQAANVDGTQRFRDILSGLLDERFLAVANLQTHPQLTADLIVTGPTGIWLFQLNDRHGHLSDSEREDGQHTSSLANWSYTSEAIGASLHTSAQLEPATIAKLLPLKGGVIYMSDREQRQLQAEAPTAVRFGRLDECRRWLEEPSARDDVEQLTIFQILDSLLVHHQALRHLETVSALTLAQKLMKREKDALLRMAATL